MNLKPQDIYVLLKILSLPDRQWSYHPLAASLSMSPSEVHAAIQRAKKADLAIAKGNKAMPIVRNLLEFIVSGLRYVFVPEQGELTTGIPTVSSADPLKSQFADSAEKVFVWPDPKGKSRGISFSPLYPTVPKATRDDPAFYELLVLVDAIRAGTPRERVFAIGELTKRLES